MAKLLDWRWWVGSLESVDGEGVFEIDECRSREEAIAAGERETPAGDSFCIIEARMWDRADKGSDDVQPFARFKNREIIVAGLGRPQ